jgi:predicted N-acyltransferase
VFGLFWQTYENASIRFERLNRRFFDLLAAEPVSHFVLLRERGSGDLVAFMLCFALGDLVINKFIGIDYARPEEWLLYFRLWEAALDWSLGRGAAAIQSGQTGYAPKIEIGHALTPMSNHARHRNWLVHRIYAAVAGAITWSTLDADLARYVKAHPDQGNRLAITPTHT